MIPETLRPRNGKQGDRCGEGRLWKFFSNCFDLHSETEGRVIS